MAKMTLSETLEIFHRYLNESDPLLRKLRRDPDYPVDAGIGMFESWLTNEVMRPNWNLVYGPKLQEKIIQIIEAIGKRRKEKFREAFKILCFILGPSRLELCGPAVTPAGALSD